MARTTFPIQTAWVSTASALSASAVDGANGNQFAMTTVGRYVLNIRHTGANNITAVMWMNTAVQGVTVPKQTAVIASSLVPTQWAVPATVATQSDGNCYLDWSGGAATAQATTTIQYVPLTGV